MRPVNQKGYDHEQDERYANTFVRNTTHLFRTFSTQPLGVILLNGSSTVRDGCSKTVHTSQVNPTLS